MSVRGWFGFAALTTFVLVVVAVLVGVLLLGVADDSSEDRIARAATMLRQGADRWHDPEWREASAVQLAADDVSFVLFEDSDELFRSTATGAGVEAEPGQAPAGADWGAERGNGLVRSIDIDGHDPSLTAQLYAPLEPDDPFSALWRATLVIGGIAAAVSFAFGRPFIRPLRAVREAARRVAEGDMDVTLPHSRITEVDDVVVAFDQMTTELDRSLGQQAQLEQERRLFIGAIAHDLRTPLFSLRGYLEGLETGLAETPEQRARYLAIAGEKTRTLDRLVNDLFDYTRLEYLDQSLRLEQLDLAEILQDLVDGLRPQAATKDVTLELFPHDHSLPILADREQLVRAATNLVENAIRHTPSGSRVDVSCGAAESGAWFTVADTGPGIDPADLPHVFQPLFRGSHGGDAPTGGAGLGLAIAQRILVAHGGTLDASNGPTGGAVFTATLSAGTEAGGWSDHSVDDGFDHV